MSVPAYLVTMTGYEDEVIIDHREDEEYRSILDREGDDKLLYVRDEEDEFTMKNLSDKDRAIIKEIRTKLGDPESIAIWKNYDDLGAIVLSQRLDNLSIRLLTCQTGEIVVVASVSY